MALANYIGVMESQQKNGSKTILMTALNNCQVLSNEEKNTQPINERNNKIDLVLREYLPLGMKLLMNDKSGLVRIVKFPHGLQAHMVMKKANWIQKFLRVPQLWNAMGKDLMISMKKS